MKKEDKILFIKIVEGILFMFGCIFLITGITAWIIEREEFVIAFASSSILFLMFIILDIRLEQFQQNG